MATFESSSNDDYTAAILNNSFISQLKNKTKKVKLKPDYPQNRLTINLALKLGSTGHHDNTRISGGNTLFKR